MYFAVLLEVTSNSPLQGEYLKNLRTTAYFECSKDLPTKEVSAMTEQANNTTGSTTGLDLDRIEELEDALAAEQKASRRTISQGLRHIKRLKGRMGELSVRASASVSYEAGKKPPFDFNATREEVGKVREELVRLEAAVARANATTDIRDGDRTLSLAEAIRRLQEIKAEIAWLSGLTLRQGTERAFEDAWNDEFHRLVRRPQEVTYESCLTEPQRVEQVDALRNRFEALNDAVEAANHRTEIQL